MSVEFTREDVYSRLPRRRADAHKGMCGRALLLCGSRGYTGAAALAALGALRTGIGLVYLGVPESIYAIEAVKLTEPVIFPLPDRDGMLSEEALPHILDYLPKMDAVLIGPGLGQSPGTLAVLEGVLRAASCPVVVDADGINLLARHRTILRGRTGPTVLTPHDGEFARLGGGGGPDREHEARRLARELGCVMVRKGCRTLTTDGELCYVNTTGHPGMAVGGTGDLLAGMLTSLLAQGMAPMDGAACAVWLHGAAGELCARDLGVALLPTDMAACLPRLFQ